MRNVHGRGLAVWTAVVFAWLVAGSVAHADRKDRDASVARLVEYGRMPTADARRLVRTISNVMRDNAKRGGDQYDWLRRTINKMEYGAAAGPGRTRVEFEDRMRRVLSVLEDGLGERTLEAFFPAGEGSALRCTEGFGVTMSECDALLAAASRSPSPIPYARPDDGRTLTRALESEGLSRREADRLVERISAMMLGVPGNVGEDTRGQRISALLTACPGGLPSKESQVRAWHVGPAEGMVRCIVSSVVSRAGAQSARLLADQLESPLASTEALVRWASPDQTRSQVAQSPATARPSAASTPSASPASSPSAPSSESTAASDPADAAQAAEQWRAVARRHYQVREYKRAVTAYQTAVSLEPNNAGTYAGLGASRLAMGDAPGAVSAYQRAIELDPDNAGFYTALARAQARIGDREGAIASLRRAVELDPTSRTAREGLAHFGVTVHSPARPESTPTTVPKAAPAVPAYAAPPAQSAHRAPAPVQRSGIPSSVPMSPSREAILSVMRPLQARIASCKPDFHGVATFRISIMGATGLVDDVSVETPGLSDTVEGDCMEGIVRGASFPVFQKSELQISYPYRL